MDATEYESYNERSRRALMIGEGSKDWNNRFREALRREGLKLVAFHPDRVFTKGDPHQAPVPCPGEPDPFLWPSLMAEMDDDTDYTVV